MSKLEIGSEFDLDLEKLHYKENNVILYLKDYNTIFVESGRSALRYLLQYVIKNDGNVLLPNYLCDSIIEAIGDISNIRFYEVNRDLSINITSLAESINDKTRAVLYINYYGVIHNENTIKVLDAIKSQGIVIIEDTTHSIFTDLCVIGDYCICSLRKWFALPDGGVIYSKKLLVNNISNEFSSFSDARFMGMKMKNNYLNEIISDKSKYIRLLNDAEHILNGKKTINKMTNLSQYILSCYDLKEIIRRRRENYLYIKHNLCNKNIDNIINEFDDNVVPLGYPIYVKKRDELRRLLTIRNVFCAVHWPIPSKIIEINKAKEHIANDILTIPIDQRYGIDEMKYIVNILNRYGDE